MRDLRHPGSLPACPKLPSYAGSSGGRRTPHRGHRERVVRPSPLLAVFNSGIRCSLHSETDEHANTLMSTPVTLQV